MKNNKKAEAYNSSIIGELLRNTNVADAAKIEKKMLIAAKIDDALRAKKWLKKDLLEALGKSNPSEVSKWLSGTHNFTIEILIDLESVLGIKLLDINQKNNPITTRYYVETNSEINNAPSSYHLNDVAGNNDVVESNSSFIIS